MDNIKSLLRLHRSDSENPIVIPNFLVPTILELGHDHDTVIHVGMLRTLHILKPRVWWSSMTKDINNYIRTCNVCKRKKRHPDQNIPILGQTSSKAYPKLTCWSCDIVSFRTPSGPQQNKHLLTIMDY